jgi:SNF2 family DNA or RNA helicase|nr:MAG TPA: Helicase of the snf2 rad54 family [Caudoviricetes sp.]
MLKKEQLHDYQVKAVDMIVNNFNCGLFLDCGLGKTVSTLTAIQELREIGFIDKVLIIAPKKVAQVTWKDEINNWEHLKGLRISVIDGTAAQRRAAMMADADIYTVSRDNVVWLVVEHGGVKLPYDMVVIDELSSFKNYASKRFKALRRVRKFIPRVVGLTGTPAPNGLIDLWAQMFLIDEGKRLGKTITDYRNRFFTAGRKNGDIVYQWDLKSPAEETEQKISDLIKDICISMSAEDYLKMPDKLMYYDRVKLSDKDFKAYKTFEREQVLEFIESGETITAASAAALSNKLQQFANGAMYDADRNVLQLHDEKIEKLKELVEAANGQPVLIAYTFKHDLDNIMDALKEYKPVKLEKPEQIADWNAGKINVLVTHPASAGHGLNLQKGGHIMIWYGLTWALELYQQFNARLYRQGQKKPVSIHHIIATDTVDEKIIKSLDGKDTTQRSLMDAIKEIVELYKTKI